MSSALKGALRRIDIGAFSERGLFYPNVARAIEQCAKGTRPPVRHPNQVAAMLEEKSFFARADVATVATLYRDFFEEVAPWCDRLKLAKLGWGDAELQDLAAALPSFVRLSELDLSENQFGLEGARHLASWVAASTSLTTLLLTRNSLGAEGAKALAPAIAGSSSLTSVDLSLNELGSAGAEALVAAIAGSSSLTKVCAFLPGLPPACIVCF